MDNLSTLEVEAYLQPPSRRSATRRAAATSGTLRAPRSQAEPIRLCDMSAEGCGFEARWPFSAGTRVWLRLPGLELWAATVVWFDDGRGGLKFDRPMHPAVVLRFLA